MPLIRTAVALIDGNGLCCFKRRTSGTFPIFLDMRYIIHGCSRHLAMHTCNPGGADYRIHDKISLIQIASELNGAIHGQRNALAVEFVYEHFVSLSVLVGADRLDKAD